MLAILSRPNTHCVQHLHLCSSHSKYISFKEDVFRFAKRLFPGSHMLALKSNSPQAIITRINGDSVHMTDGYALLEHIGLILNTFSNTNFLNKCCELINHRS